MMSLSSVALRKIAVRNFMRMNTKCGKTMSDKRQKATTTTTTNAKAYVFLFGGSDKAKRVTKLTAIQREEREGKE